MEALEGISELEQRGRHIASEAELLYVNKFTNGLRRRRRGKGFSYYSVHTKTPVSARTRARVESLAIPPAWEDVWICANSKGHIQAVGRDEAGRRQYIYHTRWKAISAATKYDRMQLMAELLPRIRRRARQDLNRGELTKEKVLAAVIRVIDKGKVRVGNQKYTEEHGSRGATTLASEHVEVDGFKISLDFPGKSGKQREIEFSDNKTAEVISQCEEIEGQYLFCYHDDDGAERSIESTDVNAYLKDVSGHAVSAKDFRTWSGSVIALSALLDLDDDLTPPQRKRAVNEAVEKASEALGNTKAVCRGSYIHPGILAAAETGELAPLLETARSVANEKPTPELVAGERLLAVLLTLLSGTDRLATPARTTRVRRC